MILVEKVGKSCHHALKRPAQDVVLDVNTLELVKPFRTCLIGRGRRCCRAVGVARRAAVFAVEAGVVVALGRRGRASRQVFTDLVPQPLATGNLHQGCAGECFVRSVQ
ncbi:hypothetical protein [Burkholderia multivorans]|uniref:hypothetical protein n=1 Tax=Burkholderia multivorans TaxID=87883 RepID=UPI0021C0EAF2|nr:hypothetical protein [Burkholderia multivorans]